MNESYTHRVQATAGHLSTKLQLGAEQASLIYRHKYMGGGLNFDLEFKHIPQSQSFGTLMLERASGDLVFPIAQEPEFDPLQIAFHYIKLAAPCPQFNDDPGLICLHDMSEPFSLFLVLGRYISSAIAEVTEEWGPEGSFITTIAVLDKLQFVEEKSDT